MATRRDKTLWGRLCEATADLEESQRSPYFVKICSVRQSSVSRWRTGEHVLGLANAKSISADTGFCVQYLIDGTGLQRYDLHELSAELQAALHKMNSEGREEVLNFPKFLSQD